jgi:hypothetical protein
MLVLHLFTLSLPGTQLGIKADATEADALGNNLMAYLDAFPYGAFVLQLDMTPIYTGV